MLLEWVPVVVALPELALLLPKMGIKADIVLADAVELALVSEQLAFQQPVRIYKAAADPLAQAIQLLLDEGHRAINICAPLPASPNDDIYWKPFAESCSLAWFWQYTKAWYVPVGDFYKWLPADDTVRWRYQGTSQLQSYQAERDGLWHKVFDRSALLIESI
jgi:hypothetical protein